MLPPRFRASRSLTGSTQLRFAQNDSRRQLFIFACGKIDIPLRGAICALRREDKARRYILLVQKNKGLLRRHPSATIPLTYLL